MYRITAYGPRRSERRMYGCGTLQEAIDTKKFLDAEEGWSAVLEIGADLAVVHGPSRECAKGSEHVGRCEMKGARR